MTAREWVYGLSERLEEAGVDSLIDVYDEKAEEGSPWVPVAYLTDEQAAAIGAKCACGECDNLAKQFELSACAAGHLHWTGA